MTHTGRQRFTVLLAAIAALALAGAVLALLFSPVQAQEGDAPPAPTGLASEVSHDSVTLTWDDPQDDSITGYRILRRETDRQAPGVFTTINENTGSARTAYTDGTVEPETRYVYRVKAINAHGVSGRSNYADADTPAEPTPETSEPPAAPQNLISAAAHDHVVLSWDDPQDDSITGYRILRRETDRQAPGVFTTIDEDTGSADNSYTDSKVEPETRYVYRVKAINAHGVSGQSNYADADTPAEPQPTSTPEASEPPAAPQNLISAAAHDHVVLSWDDPQDDSITGYRILRRETDRQAPGVFTTIDKDTGSADNSYTDSKVEPETRYVYRVKAINAHGVSGQSNYADADTPAEPQPTSTPEASEPPAAPQNLISAAAHDHVVLSWDDPQDDSITGYRILRRETDRQDPGVFTTIDEDTGSAETAYSDDTVAQETRYVYRVKAINAHGLSAQSNDARANTPAEPRTARQGVVGLRPHSQLGRRRWLWITRCGVARAGRQRGRHHGLRRAPHPEQRHRQGRRQMDGGGRRLEGRSRR